MKKTVFFTVLTLLMILSLGSNTRAQGNQGGISGTNLLNLSNLLRAPGSSGTARTMRAITVKAGHQYTIVMDYGFMGLTPQELTGLKIRIEDHLSRQVQESLVIEDSQTQAAYIEFTAIGTEIHILDLPMMPSNYNAIMYEGSFLDFMGYTPFLNPSEIMSYYGVLPMDYDQLMLMDQIKGYIGVHDPSGTPLIKTIVSDSFSSGSKLPGTYQIVFSAEFNNISKNYYLDVRIFDQAPPIITNPGVILVPLNAKLSIEQIKALITVTDNVDNIISSDLVVTNDTYSAATLLGLYEITVQATDSSQNRTIETISIQIVDQSPPVIIGPDELYLYTTDLAMTNSEILDYFEIIDEIEGFNVTVTFTQNTYLQTQVPGIYNLEIHAVDSQGNASTFGFKIHVIENKGPIFTSEAIILSVAAANAMTNQEIIDWFIAHTLLQGHNVEDVVVLFSEYANNEDKEGTYYVYLSYMLNGEEATSRISVDVENESTIVKYIPYFATGIPVLIGGIVIYKLKKRK